MEVPMSDLTPEDEALLERARLGVGEATPEDHGRVKRKLWAQVGIAAGTSAVATSGGASAGLAATGAAGSGLLASAGKIVVALAIGAGAGTGVVMTYDHRTAHGPPVSQAPAAAEPSSTLSSAQPDPTSERRTSEPQAEPIASAPPRAAIRDRLPPPVAVSAPSLSDDRPNTPSPAESPPLVAPAQPAPRLEPSGPATVAAEAELLRRADAALKAADPSRALALLGEHATTFPNGILVEERDAERIVVLCALGRTEDARAAAAQFLRLRPRSPLSQRVRESCGGI
jgi:hypothetical protein